MEALEECAIHKEQSNNPSHILNEQLNSKSNLIYDLTIGLDKNNKY